MTVAGVGAWRGGGGARRARGPLSVLVGHARTRTARACLAPHELERVARTVHQQPADAPALDALTVFLRTARDPRKRRMAQLALDAAGSCADWAPQHISLVLAARLAVCDTPRLATLEALCQEYPTWTPSAADYTHLLYALCRQRDPDALTLWDTMRERRIFIPPKAANAVLTTALLHAPMHTVRALAALAEEQADEHRRVALTTLLQGYCNRYADAQGDEPTQAPLDAPSHAEIHTVARTLHAALCGTRDAVGWHAYLTYQSLLFGPAAMMEHAHAARASGVLVPDAWTLSTLALGYLHHAPPTTCDEALALLAQLVKATGVVPDRHVTALLVQAVLGHTVRIGYRRFPRPPAPDPGRTVEAQAVFEEIVGLHGVQPDAGLLQPLIEAHCYAFVPALDAAYALLAVLRPKPARSLLWRAPVSPPHTDLGTYYPLLMACVRLRDVARALDLFREMQHVVVPAHAATTLVLQLWAVCTTYAEAWQVYQAVHKLGALDAASYAHIVAACCRLQLQDHVDGPRRPMPPVYPLAILGDMRAARFHPAPATYTILLDFYAKSPRATLAGVQATHELIKRDLHLEPDLILVNTLMNAYNHVGAPGQVLGIWDSLVVLCTNANRLAFLDEVSLVVVLDACGRTGLLGAARRALDTARQLERQTGTLLVSKNVHDAWIECLARCGRLQEADEVLFGMHDADAKTLQTFVRFAAAAHTRGTLPPAAWHTLRTRIQSRFAHLWEHVAQIV